MPAIAWRCDLQLGRQLDAVCSRRAVVLVAPIDHDGLVRGQLDHIVCLYGDVPERIEDHLQRPAYVLLATILVLDDEVLRLTRDVSFQILDFAALMNKRIECHETGAQATFELAVEEDDAHALLLGRSEALVLLHGDPLVRVVVEEDPSRALHMLDAPIQVLHNEVRVLVGHEGCAQAGHPHPPSDAGCVKCNHGCARNTSEYRDAVRNREIRDTPSQAGMLVAPGPGPPVADAPVAEAMSCNVAKV